MPAPSWSVRPICSAPRGTGPKRPRVGWWCSWDSIAICQCQVRPFAACRAGLQVLRPTAMASRLQLSLPPQVERRREEGLDLGRATEHWKPPDGRIGPELGWEPKEEEGKARGKEESPRGPVSALGGQEPAAGPYLEEAARGGEARPAPRTWSYFCPRARRGKKSIADATARGSRVWRQLGKRRFHLGA